MKTKERATFAAGFATSQALTHGAMAATDTEFTLLGMTYTRELNTIATAFWAIVLVVLVYYAWMGRAGPRDA